MNLPSWIETDLDRSKWIAYNRYFKDNPEMLMGEMVSSRNMYGNEGWHGLYRAGEFRSV